ncbi:MAG TPA: sugar ABC transporter permease [Egibacteraceae bacterium]|nr:sugar ABC transporter permease [Egibacteraceae bacterium]
MTNIKPAALAADGAQRAAPRQGLRRVPEAPVHRRRLRIHILVFLLPAVAIYTSFMIYPLLDSVRLAFFGATSRFDGPTSEVFVGLDNFRRLLTDQRISAQFWNALRNNFVFFAIHALVQNPVGLLLAALLSDRTRRFAAAYRTLIFIPTTLSVVIVGFVWQLILSPLWGIVETPLLGLPRTALITISLMSVWQWVGIPMILFYAVLISIPEELLEAGRIDGASPSAIFWRIKLPLLLPTVGMVTIITYVANMNAFDLIYTVQGALAGPEFSTDIMGTLFFRTFAGFQLQLGNPTMGAAVATMMFLIILAGVLVYLFAWSRRVTTYEL